VLTEQLQSTCSAPGGALPAAVGQVRTDLVRALPGALPKSKTHLHFATQGARTETNLPHRRTRATWRGVRRPTMTSRLLRRELARTNAVAVSRRHGTLIAVSDPFEATGGLGQYEGVLTPCSLWYPEEGRSC